MNQITRLFLPVYKTAFVILVAFLAQNIQAQNKVNAELAYRRIFVSSIQSSNHSDWPQNDTYANSIRFLLGYHINNYLNVNAGMGLDGYYGSYSANTIPIVVNVKYTIGGLSKGLFLMAEGGPQITFSEGQAPGYMMLGAIGYKLKLSRLLRLNFMAGYNFQKSTEGNYWFDDDAQRSGMFIGTSISL